MFSIVFVALNALAILSPELYSVYAASQAAFQAVNDIPYSNASTSVTYMLDNIFGSETAGTWLLSPCVRDFIHHSLKFAADRQTLFVSARS